MRHLILLIATTLLFSCNSGKNKTQKEAKKATAQKVIEEDIQEFRLKTKTGKEFIVTTESKNASQNDITVTPKGFEEVNEPMTVKDADPVADVFTADLNGDGFEELYVITRSAGSGSYATIYGWSSNSDKSVTPIYIPELPESKQAEVFKGHMGHDSIYVKNNRLYRKFPVYKEGDANCCPSGGAKVVKYILKPGEASWILEFNNY